MNNNYLNSTSYTSTYKILGYYMFANYDGNTNFFCGATAIMAISAYLGYPYICQNLYNEPFCDKQLWAINSDIWLPNVTITNNGKTLNWNWKKGKSSQITAIFLTIIHNYTT